MKKGSKSKKATAGEPEQTQQIAGPLKTEFHLALDALKRTILAIPSEEWCRGDTKAAEPVRQAAHLLWGLEFLFGKGKKVSSRFGVPVASFRARIDPGDYPSQKKFVPWINEAETIAHDYIDDGVEAVLSGRRVRKNPLAQATYALRHTTVHLAYLRQEAGRRGVKLPGY